MRKKLGTILVAALLLSGCSSAASKDMAVNDFAMVPEAAMAGDHDGVYETAAYDLKLDSEAVEDASAPLIYAVFGQETKTVTANDGTRLFISQTCVPFLDSGRRETNIWLQQELMKITEQTGSFSQTIRQQAAEDYESLQSSPADSAAGFYTYSCYSNMSVRRLDERIVSILQVNSTYSGGATPDYAQLSYNLDLVEQTRLSLTDVIFPDAAEALLDQLLLQLENRLNTLEHVGVFPDFKERIISCFSDPDSSPDWYFSDRGMVIYFNSSDIAPHATGIIEAEFQYEMLEQVLRPEYFPDVLEGEEGSVELLKVPENRTVLHTSMNEPAGNGFYLSASETVYDVDLYQLSSWVTEETPIVGQMSFSANRLTRAEALYIEESGEAQNPEYLLTYRSAAGERAAVAVSQQGLREVSVLISD